MYLVQCRVRQGEPQRLLLHKVLVSYTVSTYPQCNTMNHLLGVTLQNDSVQREKERLINGNQILPDKEELKRTLFLHAIIAEARKLNLRKSMMESILMMSLHGYIAALMP